MATGGRKTHLQLIHEISQTLGPNSPLSGVLGILPAGGVAIMSRVLTSTVFNSTTNTLSLGTTPGGTNLVNATDIKAAVALAATPIPAAQMGPFAADTPIYYTLASTGAAPTAGAVTAWVEYLPHVS